MPAEIEKRKRKSGIEKYNLFHHHASGLESAFQGFS